MVTRVIVSWKSNEKAYICNLNEHWFTLRQFGHSPKRYDIRDSMSRWYNLNSTLKTPEYISELYLVFHEI
jgi:ataxin-3